MSCLECGRHFVSVAKLRSHEKTHSKSRPFKCIDCGKTFTGLATSHVTLIDAILLSVRYSLICHTRTHTRERPYQVCHCRPRRPCRHLSCPNPLFLPQCSSCGSRFTQASSLKTHQIYKHTKQFPYACKQCGRGFISPGQRHEHVSRTHLKLQTGRKPRAKTAAATPDVPLAPTMSSTSCQTSVSLPPLLYACVDFETSDETTTLSLPSLSVANNRTTRETTRDDERRRRERLTIRDSERAAEELKRENFSLKLRIYCLEKNQNNLEMNSENIQTFEEIKRLNNEFNQLSRDYEESKQLSLSLIQNLQEFCRLFRDDNEDDRRREQRLCRLLDRSEDLLNCAQILVTKRESDERVERRALRESSDESDIWSEPDRDVSRARIGLRVSDDQKQQKRGKRRPKGEKSSFDSNVDQKDNNLSKVTTHLTTDDVLDDDTFSPFDIRSRDVRTHSSNSLFAFCAKLSPIRRQSAEFVPNIVLQEKGKTLEGLEALLAEVLAESEAQLSGKSRDALLTAISVWKEFSEENSLLERFLRLKKSKQRMEKEISRSLNKTQELIVEKTRH
ncbi:unnamed protein product [Medioppia subpectinata]|uniref:C2H2-type domain-containing protein n=1 Tax=Medioppia subpectinata TaxID=1979941 RepID=A0A7R9Q5M6_9ACAR|nr:unnamed protein product [Medioppia subpectinata]CAG2113908.1 unnamed protein product [Medioppia subpectinata]